MKNGEGSQQEAVLLVNSKSRLGRDSFELAQTTLLEKGFNLKKSRCYLRATDLFNDAKSFVNEIETMIIGGGDGTLNGATNLLVNSNTRLGVLPLGTGNAFARDLGIASNVDEAIEVILEGRTEELDVGKCGDYYFVNVVTAGLSSQIAQNLTGPMKKKFGKAVYLFAVFRALKDIKSFWLKIETENGTKEFESIQVVIGNGHYHGGPFPVSPDASLTTGRQSIYIVESSTKLSLLKYALALPTGLQGLMSQVHAEEAVSGKITTLPSKTVTIDGENRGRTPIIFSTAAQSLKVIVPKNFAG